MELKILNPQLLPDYLNAFPKASLQAFEVLKDSPLSTGNFSFYTSVASVFSSKIEGEDIQLDSYIKHKRDGIPFQADYTKKTDDLYEAYTFAQNKPLHENNIAEAHKILSRHFVVLAYQGKLRTQNMYVATDDGGRIEYVAALPSILKREMQKLYADLEVLLEKNLPLEEVFFFAAMIHLVFVKIHPWNDGNGRTARLLEKWFIAQKLGEKAWLLESEKNYYFQHQTYYKNLRVLGLEYPELDYSKALAFLMMLPNSLLKA